MEALKEMMQEHQDRVFYNAIMNDMVINEAFSANHESGSYEEWIARARYTLMQFMRADKTGKQMVAQDFGLWFLSNAEQYVKGVAENEY